MRCTTVTTYIRQHDHPLLSTGRSQHWVRSQPHISPHTRSSSSSQPSASQTRTEPQQLLSTLPRLNRPPTPPRPTSPTTTTTSTSTTTSTTPVLPRCRWCRFLSPRSPTVTPGWSPAWSNAWSVVEVPQNVPVRFVPVSVPAPPPPQVQVVQVQPQQGYSQPQHIHHYPGRRSLPTSRADSLDDIQHKQYTLHKFLPGQAF